ncbi:MAG TPA: trypsin-like peptidase domain-containing protein [Longimicrobiales bacterium]|nr:trypsin-like peptidase domain-containing protein [Longimicrobiales bacterium]
MVDPIRSKVKYLGVVAVAFLAGAGLSVGLDRGGPVRVLPPIGEASWTQTVASVPRSPLRAAELGDAFAAIAEAVTPAVVRIQTERLEPVGHGARAPHGLRDFFGWPPGNGAHVPAIAGGSGFIVSPDGYILTNNHVIAGADRIRVTLVDRRDFEAEVVGQDPTTDVAVIRIDARDLPFVTLGDSDQTRVGEWVLAIGNPGFDDSNTLDFTVTSGIISAKGRPLDIIPRELAAEDNAAAGYAIEDFIQTDAVINPGNSGGPLVNLRGEVVGVNTAIASETGYYQGYGFAIPVNLARRVMRDLIEHGHVKRALLGITIKDVSPEDAEVYRLPAIAGVLVEDFAEDSPARRAGLRQHDVIVSLNGQPVERVGQLQRLVAQHRPGDMVEVGAIRYGERVDLRIRLTQAPITAATARPARRTAPASGERLGIQVSELTPELAREMGWDRPGGAVISGVRAMSAAERKGILSGQRIVSIDGREIRTAQEAREILRNARSGQILSLTLLNRGGRTTIANVRVP